MNKIWNNTNSKQILKNRQKLRRRSEPTSRVNCSLYLQQAGENDATNRFPKPARHMTVGRLAKLLATFQRLWRRHSQTRLRVPYRRDRWRNALLRNKKSWGNVGRKTQSTFDPCCKGFVIKPDQPSTSSKAIGR